MTYEQLDKFSQQVSQSDCGRIDQVIGYLEQQLRQKGLINADPERLDSKDRSYNSLARIVIWNLRIGCNNPK